MEELVSAIEQSDYDQIHNFISLGTNVIQAVKYKGVIKPPVSIAALLSCPEMVELLLKSGADINFPDESGSKALHSVLELKSGSHQIVATLLENGANINMENKKGHSPLYLAVHTHSVSTVELVLKYSPDLNCRANQEVFAVLLRDCIKRYSNDCWQSQFEERFLNFTRMTQLLYDYGFSLPVDWLDDYQLYINAVHLGLLGTCEDFLSHGAITTDALMEGLELAINKQYIPLIEMMLKYRSDLLSTDYSHPGRERPFLYAASNSNPPVVQCMIKLGAAVNCTNFQGDTPLIAAVRSNELAMVKVLLEAGADVESHRGKPLIQYALERYGERPSVFLEDWEGDDTDYMFALEKDKFAIITSLIEAGADVHWRGADGETFLHVLCKGPSYSMYDEAAAGVLLRAGVDIDARDGKGETALHKAFRVSRRGESCCVAQLMSLCRYLVSLGADLNLRSNRGRSPVDTADYSCLHLLHLGPMVVAGLVHSSNPNLTDLTGENFKKRLKTELHLMEESYIAKTRITYRDFLNFDPDQLARSLENTDILQELQASGYKTKFPLYSKLLAMKLLVGKRRMKVLEHGRQILTAISEAALPVVCCDQILFYLSGDDLRKIDHL